MSIGENLKRLRQERGMSQKELSEAVGISQPMVAQMERGTKAITIGLGKEIASILKCDITEFISETPDSANSVG